VVRRISLVWVLLLALVWAALAAPRADAWLAGALAVATGVLLHTALGGRQGIRLSALGAARFLPYFVVNAIWGGVDVARRSLSPSLPIDPGFLTYDLRLPEGAPRLFFANCLSLLPGTFTARLVGPTLTVHLLESDAAATRRLAALERRVADLFGVTLDDREGSTGPNGQEGPQGSRGDAP